MPKNLGQLSRLCQALSLAVALGGCGEEKPRLDQLTPDSAVTSKPVALATDSLPNSSFWKISPQGFGPLHAGMSVKDVESFVPHLSAPADIATSDCVYARSSSLPVGAVLMFAKGSLARVDILSGRVQADLGARIGDTEDQLKLLYGKAIATTPHKYTEGHYMTIRAESDSTARIVFETDGFKVVRFRSGRTPEVEFVEGCS